MTPEPQPKARRQATWLSRASDPHVGTPNLPTHIVDFGGFDSSIMLIVRGGILVPIGDFPESLTQATLVTPTLD